MKVKVEATTKTFVQFWLVPLGLGLAGLAVYSARSALIIIGTAFFLALALNTPVSSLARHLPGRSRVVSTAISFVAVIAFISAFIFLALPPIMQQTAKFIETVPNLVEDVRTQWQGLNTVIERYNLQPQVDQALNSMQNSASSWAARAGSNLISGVESIFGFVTAAVLTLVLSFLMLVEGPMWMKRIWDLYTDEEKRDFHRNITSRMHTVVSGYVTGQLTVSSIGAVAAGLVVFILSFFFDIPTNLAIPTAAITFILSLIPMFGATIGGTLIALLLFFNDPVAAIIYIIFFVLYQQLENNYISPSIQSKRLELSALAILVSVTIGLYLFGVVGGIISIPIAGCIKVLLETYLEQSNRKRRKTRSPIAKLSKSVSKD